MINIRVLEANNIPIFKNKQRKTTISCYSYSSYRFFYGTYKSKDKSTNPQWDLDFNADLFKIIHLRFFLYGLESNDNNIFIGSVTFNFVQFISSSPGNQILSNPGSGIINEFPIKSSKTSDAKLTLSFTYIPTVYPKNQIKLSFSTNPILHIYTTFSPSLNHDEKPVEIEILQAYSLPNENGNRRLGYYYSLNKETPWEIVGKSSLDRCFLGPTGLSQIHSLSIPRIKGKYTFFILNVSKFIGKVTLNFIYEKMGELVHVADKCFIKTKKKNQSTILAKTIDVDVVPDKKYFIPYYLFFDSNSNKCQFNRFPNETESITFDKSKIMNYSTQDYTERISSEIELGSQIIEKAHTIPDIENTNFLRKIILPINEPISLPKTLSDYNLQPDSLFRVYVGGSTTNTVGDAAYVDYWQQNFITYDKDTGKKCPKFAAIFDNQLLKQNPEKKLKSYLPTRFNWNTVLTLNFNQIEKTKVLVYYIHCNTYLQSAFQNGFFMITQYSNRSETLLFENPIYSDSWSAHFAICFRFEFVRNEWKIIPMRHYFESCNEMDDALKYMKSNNWIWPPPVSEAK
ncbi:hypothetical protein M9Y10_016259 [Tritrichomonas musculus]|uniref:C2 domain-containing protein n=1 Tax=Tritrichomonas musculus TaxID=1915356 RepID=A0ABR2HW31_9EUKA